MMSTAWAWAGAGRPMPTAILSACSGPRPASGSTNSGMIISGLGRLPSSLSLPPPLPPPPPRQRIDEFGDDHLRLGALDLLDVHAALARSDEGQLLRGAV